MRRILGNLDAEAEMARRAGARPAPTTEAALRTASALATLLRVFAKDGDLLWTPRPVDPGRVPDVPGLPRPELASGPAGDGPVAFAWAKTGKTAARVNHRAFLLDHSSAFPDRLPGIRAVRTIDEAEAGEGPFVLKAPWSAAGRLRIVARPSLRASDRRRGEDLLRRYGTLVREPWLEREEDFGVSGRVDADGVALLPPHRVRTDDRGAFRGIEGPLAEPMAGRVRDAGRRAGELLREAGYRGRFGVDGLSGRDRHGVLRLHLPCEVNARTTFGHVAAALAERLAPGTDRFALAIGRDLPSGGIRLLRPADDDPIEARLLV